MSASRPGARLGRPVKVTGERPTRERIVDAAIDLFAERGYEGTSVRQIAAAVGLTESAVYKHFAGKGAILDRILADAESYIYAPLPVEQDLGQNADQSIFRGLLAPLPEIIAASPTVTKITRIIYAEMHRDVRVRLFYRERFADKADDHLERLFRRCLEEGLIRPCNPRALARVFNAFRSEWAFLAFVVEPEKPLDMAAIKTELEASIRFFEDLLCVDRRDHAGGVTNGGRQGGRP